MMPRLSMAMIAVSADSRIAFSLATCVEAEVGNSSGEWSSQENLDEKSELHVGRMSALPATAARAVSSEPRMGFIICFRGCCLLGCKRIAAEAAGPPASSSRRIVPPAEPQVLRERPPTVSRRLVSPQWSLRARSPERTFVPSGFFRYPLSVPSPSPAKAAGSATHQDRSSRKFRLLRPRLGAGSRSG